MKDLLLNILAENNNKTHYSGFYKLRQFEMTVERCKETGNDIYTLVSGNINKDDWDNILAMHYHYDYDII